MITADQLLCHAVGDYLLQSHRMATEKTTRLVWAILHAITYSAPFLFLGPSPVAFLVILSTHAVIDRWRLAKYVIWLKNWFFGGDWGGKGWYRVTATGYPEETPAWLAVWLLIIGDNILHILINGLALRYL